MVLRDHGRIHCCAQRHTRIMAYPRHNACGILSTGLGYTDVDSRTYGTAVSHAGSPICGDGRTAIARTDNAKVNLKKKLLNEFNLHTVIRMPGSVFSPYTSITTNILFFDNTHPTEETWFYRLDMPEGYKHFSKTKPMKVEHFAPVVEWWNDRKELTVDGFDKAKKFTAAELAEELGYNFDQCGYPHEEEEILDPLDLIQRYEEQRASLNAEIDRVLAEITAKLGGNKDEQ